MNFLFRDQILIFFMSQFIGNVMFELVKFVDFVVVVLVGDFNEFQEVLLSLNVEDRMYKVFFVFKKEYVNVQFQFKIIKDVENKIIKCQWEYWLMEQMKGIKCEFGLELDGKDKLVEKFKEKVDKLVMLEVVCKVFDDELNKFVYLELVVLEFNVICNYFDWFMQILWGLCSVENFGIQYVMIVLDEDYYGFKDVKDCIFEFIVVGKLCGIVEGKIFCFVGLLGVGKISIGKLIVCVFNW